MFIYRDEIYDPTHGERRAGRDHRGQAPLRPHRHRPARVPPAVHALRQHGARLRLTRVLFEQRFWEPIARGEVTVTFRRWKRRQAIAGRRYRTPGGIIEADAVDVIRADDITEADARAGLFPSADALVADAAGHPGPRPLPDPVPRRRRARPASGARRVRRPDRRRAGRARRAPRPARPGELATGPGPSTPCA